jgi:hypothetical protein
MGMCTGGENMTTAKMTEAIKELKTRAARILDVARVLSELEHNRPERRAVRKRRISKAGRERIAAAQRARWAKHRKEAKGGK